MADNQAAREGDDALGFLRDAVQAVQTPQAPRREDVMGDALRALGINAKPKPPAAAPQPTGSASQANITTMLGRYAASNPPSSPLGFAAGLLGDMAFAGLGGQIKGDVSPIAMRTAMLQEGATAIVGETFGSVIGGMANAGGNAQNFIGQAVNTATKWYTGGQDIFDLDLSDRTKQFLSGGYSSRNALMDSAPENRARFIRSNASEAEAAAATGMSSPMAFNVGDAMGQIGLAVLSSLIPGGQPVAAANAVKATTTFGKAFNAVRAWTSNPGAKMYLGYAGGQSAIGMSKEMDEYRRRENEAIDLYNDSIERLGLPFEKRAPLEYDRLMDMGVSVASGIGTAALETVTLGLAKFGGGRVARRLMFGRAENLGNARDVVRATLAGAALGGAGEGLEESLDVYKDGFLRGIWNPYEEARFLRTFKGEDFWKTLKAYAPEAIDAAVTSFIAAGPLGGAGGAASVRRASQRTIAFHHAFMRDQMSREQGSGPDVIASELVAREIVERVMLGSSDPKVRKVVLEQLRSTGLAELGSVTAEQMTNPEWVQSFVRRNPLLASSIADRFDQLSRSNIEWMTGPASRGRVPNADQRQQFLNMVKGEVRSLVPAYMRGWAERASVRYGELARTVDQLSREMSGLEGEALEQAYARRMAAMAEMSEIRQINNRMKASRVRGETPSEQEFREWQVLTAQVEATDLDGTADAEADSPATEAFEAASVEQPADEQAIDQPPPMSEAKRLRIAARQGDTEAAFRLAQMHETGEGAERHAAKAEYWLNVALAAQGDADALFYLGEFYRLRVQSESGLKKAIVLLSRAARAGSTRAQAALGEVQAQRGNVSKASDLFRKAGQDGAKGLARLVLTGQLPASEITTELIQNLEQQSLAGDPEAEGLFRWAIDARRQALPARATETPSAASAAPAPSVPAAEATAAPAASEAVSAAEPAAIPPDDPVAQGVQRLIDAQQARRDAAQAEKDAKKAELERRARVRAERAEAGRRKAEEAKARVAAETAVEPEVAAEPVAEPQPEAAPAVQAEPAPEPVQDEAARIQERVRRSPGSTGRERVRMVEPDTTVRKRIARAAAKLGRKVQFIAVEKSSGVIRGFVSPDSDTIYLAVLPVQAERQSPEQVVESYYLQALLHENAHLSLEDGAIRDRVDRVITDELKRDFASRFDLGGDAEAAQEEVRVYTLTQDIIGSSGAADIVLGEGVVSAVSARIKELFAKALPFLPNARRKALLASMIKEQVREAKAAKPKPATAASLNAAVAAGDTVTATTERGGEMQEVTYGKDAEFIERKGVLYAKVGKVLERLDSPAVVPAKPAVGKARAKKAAPKPEAKPQPAATPKPEAKVDPANEPVASELPRPKRGRGKRGDGQQAMFMREKQWGMPRMGSAFSGMGTWEIALRGLAEPVRGVEISPNIAVAYALNNGDHVEVTDVTKVPSDFAKDMDLFCASPVCKAYSDANRNRGEQGLDIASANWVASVVRDSRPANIAIENVPSYRSSEAYKIIEASLREAGYQFDAAVYDASDFGAATSRKRLIIPS
ncbi:MAG: DNA cytosine methyltransferase [Phycisphaerales bacterium]